MFYQIITHTPIWVWAVFALITRIGLKQALPSTSSLRRITLITLAMLGLSLYGTVSVFGLAGTLLLTWGFSFAVVATLTAQRALSPLTRYNGWTQRVELPGSWVPLVLMLGIFITKYGVGITSAMRPDVLHHPAFGYGIGAIYGAFSGVFAGRAVRLWRLALGHNADRNVSEITGHVNRHPAQHAH